MNLKFQNVYVVSDSVCYVLLDVFSAADFIVAIMNFALNKSIKTGIQCLMGKWVCLGVLI